MYMYMHKCTGMCMYNVYTHCQEADCKAEICGLYFSNATCRFVRLSLASKTRVLDGVGVGGVCQLERHFEGRATLITTNLQPYLILGD